MQNITYATKIDKFKQLVQALIFQDPQISKFMNADILVEIWNNLNEICQFNLKTMEDKRYLDEVTQLFKQITGQDIENRTQKTEPVQLDLLLTIFQISLWNIFKLKDFFMHFKDIDESKILMISKGIEEIHNMKIFNNQIKSQGNDVE